MGRLEIKSPQTVDFRVAITVWLERRQPLLDSLLQTIALQTGLDFRFLVVIDDGLSWITTCQRLDPSSRPIVVRSNGGQTFNIFDTRGNPLSPKHLASATALVHLLAADQDRDNQLQQQIDENERLRAQIDAGMSAAKHGEQSAATAPTDAEKAAQAAVDPLVQWGEKQQ